MDVKTKKRAGQFNSEGIFETNDEHIIKKMKNRFEFENNTYKCKKCNYVTDNKGLLLAHYRAEHKKED